VNIQKLNLNGRMMEDGSINVDIGLNAFTMDGLLFTITFLFFNIPILRSPKKCKNSTINGQKGCKIG
jgi:hypothetical protein